jgi:hypothetical protein
MSGNIESSLIFGVRTNTGFSYNIPFMDLEIVRMRSVPEYGNIYLFYIELITIATHKSHFNDTLFYDFDLRIWIDADTPYDYQNYGWKLEILKLPRGRGVDSIEYKIIDPMGNELFLKRFSDTRNTSNFCSHVSAIMMQFRKISSLPSIFQHLGL